MAAGLATIAPSVFEIIRPDRYSDLTQIGFVVLRTKLKKYEEEGAATYSILKQNLIPHSLRVIVKWNMGEITSCLLPIFDNAANHNFRYRII